MNCRKARELIPERIVESLDAGAEPELEKHLKECAECRREFESYRNVIKGIKEIEDISSRLSPQALTQLIRLSAASRAPVTRLRVSTVAGWALAAIALALFLIGGRIQLSQGEMVVSWKQPDEDITTLQEPEQVRAELEDEVAVALAKIVRMIQESEARQEIKLTQLAEEIGTENQWQRDALARQLVQWRRESSQNLYRTNSVVNDLFETVTGTYGISPRVVPASYSKGVE